MFHLIVIMTFLAVFLSVSFSPITGFSVESLSTISNVSGPSFSTISSTSMANFSSSETALNTEKEHSFSTISSTSMMTSSKSEAERKTSLSSVSLPLLTVTDSTSQEDPRVEWIDHDLNILYSVDNKLATWYEAFQKCTTRGKNGHLATIDSESSLLRLRPHTENLSGNLWIGIRKSKSGAFERIGEKQSNYFNWTPGQPSNYLGNEECVELRMSLRFNDVKCDARKLYLCASDNENGTASVSSKSEELPSVAGSETTSVTSSSESSFADPENKWIDIGTDTLYSIELTLATWDEASMYCKSKGINGRLANLDSMVVTNRLQAHIEDAGYALRLWIGLRRDLSGKFERTGNVTSQSNFFNWEDGEPSNNKNVEDCVEVIVWDMKWNDMPCYEKRKFLCASDKRPSNSRISLTSITNPSNSEPELTTTATSMAAPSPSPTGPSNSRISLTSITNPSNSEPELTTTTTSMAAPSPSPTDASSNEDPRLEWIDDDLNILYFVDNTRATWYEAFWKCTKRGKNGHLATIDSESSLLRLRQHTEILRGSIWIGIRRNQSGTFERIGEKQSNYFNWAPGEPNHSGGIEDCVELRMSLRFNDAVCDFRKQYLCASDNENGAASVNSEFEESFFVAGSGTSSVTSKSQSLFADIAKESHATLTVTGFLIAFVLLAILVAVVLKRWPLPPKVNNSDANDILYVHLGDQA